MSRPEKLYLENRLSVPVDILLEPNDDDSLALYLFGSRAGSSERIGPGMCNVYEFKEPLSRCLKEDPKTGKYFVNLDFKVIGALPVKAEILFGRHKRADGLIFEIIPFRQ